MDYANTYKRFVVLTFGGATGMLLLYLIFLNATTPYRLQLRTLIVLGGIILGTLGVDIYALDVPGTSITIETGGGSSDKDSNSDERGG